MVNGMKGKLLKKRSKYGTKIWYGRYGKKVRSDKGIRAVKKWRIPLKEQ
jgi:hypothetical protein